MLFLFVKFLYIIILSFLYGHTIQRLLGQPSSLSGQTSFPLTALTGLFGISVIAAYLSLFIPLAGLAHGIILGIGIICFLFTRKSVIEQLRQASGASIGMKLFFIIAILYAVTLSAQQSITYDEGLYYAQFIKWMQFYKVVPGLANLHVRFGFNSHWHVLATVFNFSWLTGNTSNHINGVLYLLVVLYLLPGKEDVSFIRFLKLGLLVLINMPQVCVYNVIAPAADLPVFYLGCLLVVVWLENNPTGNVFLLLAPLFLVTVKVSAVPVLLITLLLFVQLLRNKSYAKSTVLVAVSLLIFAPWLIRNIILTGYPLFPMELPDLFHTGWSVPLSVIHATRQDITSFAFYRSADIARLLNDSLFQRFSTWFMHSVRVYDKLLLLFALVSPVIVFLKRKQLPTNFLPIYVFLVLGCCFWLIQAPDPRFAYGYLAPLFVITIALCLPFLQQARYLLLFCLLDVVMFQAATLILHSRLHKTFVAQKIIQDVPDHTVILPAPYSTQPVETDEAPFHMYIPLNTELCWDNPLPCADHMPKGVTMRGGSLGDGFVHEIY